MKAPIYQGLERRPRPIAAKTFPTRLAGPGRAHQWIRRHALQGPASFPQWRGQVPTVPGS